MDSGKSYGKERIVGLGMNLIYVDGTVFNALAGFRMP